MYRTCIFCPADLGTNQALEAFPVGRRVAFDAHRGRLWAVCGKCGRWNLAPLEERWEAVEDAERAFRNSRLRVQSENIGLCKLPDGTRLIRVGDALAGELAVWRYGDQLVRRRRQFLIGGAAVAAAGLVAMGGIYVLGIGGGLLTFGNAAVAVWANKQLHKVVHHLPAALSPTGREVTIRRWHLRGARLAPGDDGGLALHVPDAHLEKWGTDRWGRWVFSSSEMVLPSAQARAVLSRAMVVVNQGGASRGRVGDALRLIEGARSADAYLRTAAAGGGTLGKREGMEKRQLTPVAALALEMALHDEQERQAMEGELVALEGAWRQAEEIAAIADSLPDGLEPAEAPRIAIG
ncbi:MAG TPA: hypothetical protein VLK84_08325 [Longimicrobium sp.]|nr:hypothetical protein [Longimicrobium sp.]